MTTLTLYYGTNRAHEGTDRWNPSGYGARFSSDGAENLRFGRIGMSADSKMLKSYLTKKQKGIGDGDGEGLGDYLAQQPMSIAAYRESIDPAVADTHQPNAVFGSAALFAALKGHMDQGLIY